jgi:hypothetical protein
VADESKGSSDAMNSLGSALTSPAKLAFAEFVILVYKGAIPGLSLCTFLIIAAVFFAVQTFHDDFLRIVLNRWAFAYSGDTQLAQGVISPAAVYRPKSPTVQLNRIGIAVRRRAGFMES